MKSAALIFLIIVGLCSATSIPVSVCEATEVWQECASACEPTCEEPNPTICTLQCLPAACQCAKGFVRDKTTGKCVASHQCSSTMSCGLNEVYDECYANCQPSCDLFTGITRPQICPAMCWAGCVCAPGYVRMFQVDSFSGVCLTESFCTSCSQNLLNSSRK